jgi:hypothetical protein
MNDRKLPSTLPKETCFRTSHPMDGFEVFLRVCLVSLIPFTFIGLSCRAKEDQSKKERKSQLIKELTGKDVQPEDVHMVEIVVGAEQ